MLQDSKDWRSQTQATYKHGQQRGTDPAIYTPLAPAGIRTQMVILITFANLLDTIAITCFQELTPIAAQLIAQGNHC